MGEVERVGVVVTHPITRVEYSILIPHDELRKRSGHTVLRPSNQFGVREFVLVGGAVHDDLFTRLDDSDAPGFPSGTKKTHAPPPTAAVAETPLTVA